MNRFKQNHGLTLVELLVAISIGALVLVLLAQGLANIANWSSKLHAGRANNDSINSMLRFVRERLIRVEPITIETEDGPQVLFEGDQNQIRFVVAENAYPAQPGLYEQSLTIVQGSENNWQIWLHRIALYSLDQFGRTDATEPLLLYDGLAQPEFSFLGNTQWQQQWETSPAMPKQIGFSIAGWPQIHVAQPIAIAPWSVNRNNQPQTPPVPDED